MKRSVSLGLAMALLVLPSAPILAEVGYTPESFFLTVYADGRVAVEYHLGVDEALPTVNVTLPGTTYEDFMVTDQDGELLDAQLSDGILTVDTLGASKVKVSYSTSDLVNKTGRMWTLMLNSPTNLTVRFFREAIIVGLSEAPLDIRASEVGYMLTMAGGVVKIDYVLGVVGTSYHASMAIGDAESLIQQIRAGGVNVTAGEQTLQKAKNSFNGGLYPDAERLALQAKSLALTANSTATRASAEIEEAQGAIAEAEREGRTSGLDRVQRTIESATEEFRRGDYERSYLDAEEALAGARRATVPFIGAELLFILAGVLVVISVAIALIILRLVRRKGPTPTLTRRAVDHNRIFEAKPELRTDDREVIGFIAGCGGEAFEAEIRARFESPKTTTWRTVRRLQGMGILEVRRVGGQNLIRIRDEWV